MNRLHGGIFRLSRILEIIISFMLIIALAISMITLVDGLKELYLHPLEKDAFQKFLAIIFNVLIGIEFLKMIYKYNVDTVIEVLLFAIARQLIVEHTTVFENCIGIISIAILFLIRKYLFIPLLDKDTNKDTSSDTRKD